VQDLSLALGLGTLAPSGLGGTDFAYGGAYTGPTPENDRFPGGTASDLAAQLSHFQSMVAAPSPNALYTLWIGTNDIFNVAADPALGSSQAQQAADITASVNEEMSTVNALVQDGARNLLVVDVPDLGLIPALANERFEGPVLAQMCSDYNTQLNADLNAIAPIDNLNLHILDAFQVFDALANDPAEYGLINVTDPAWSGNFASADSGTLVSGNPVVQDQYLFFDEVHPTETVHTLLAADALDALSDPACFAAGTCVLTQRGMVPVEAVRRGDAAITHTSEPREVQWIGRRALDCRRHPNPDRVFPVRIVAHAFGHRLPARDLRLSPDHAVFIYDALIPVRCLINGATVRQERVLRVTYYHLELSTHEVVLAEGLPVETYLDLGNRQAFDNAGEAVAPRHPSACAPLILDGPLLAAVRHRLALQARLLGYTGTDDPDLHLCIGRKMLHPDRCGAGYRFLLPPHSRRVRLRSRARVAASRLSIGVDEALLDRRPISPARFGLGWHPPPARGARWTDGDAHINVYGSRELIVRIGAPGRYWIDAPIERQPAHR
jgi:hypothetical protein